MRGKHTPRFPQGVIKPRVDESVERLSRIYPDFERQVMVQCRHEMSGKGTHVRIWPSVYLWDRETGAVSKMVHHMNISLYPQWQTVPVGVTSIDFVLFFSALPKECRGFVVYEDIPEEGGFYSGRIARNDTDVYSIKNFS